MAIIGMTIGIGYGIANRAIISGRDAQERSETTKYIEAQLEKLISATSDQQSGVFNVAESDTYCLSDALAIQLDSATTCNFGPATDQRYKVTIVRDDHLFTITGKWQNIRSGYNNEATMVYRTYEFDNLALAVAPPVPVCSPGYALNGALPPVCVLIPVLNVTTGASASGITTNSATIAGNDVVSVGGAVASIKGVVYGTLPAPLISGPKVNYGSGAISFTANLTALSNGTTYYARAYATDNTVTPSVTVYGIQISFTTLILALPPTVTTLPASLVPTTNPTTPQSGNVTSAGTSSVTERGIAYGASFAPTIADGKVVAGTAGVGIFTVNVPLISCGRTYMRAYAISSVSISYGTTTSRDHDCTGN
jgi:hypothetical protein